MPVRGWGEKTDEISDYGHSSQFQILTHFGQPVSSAVERNRNLTIISITMTMNVMKPSCTDGT